MDISACVTDDDLEAWRAVRLAVVPECRRRGVGSALLQVLAEHCSGLDRPALVSGVDDEGSLAFAERFGLVEVDREVQQTRAVGTEEPSTPRPDGVEVVLLSERPELWSDCYERFGREVLADFALHTPLEISAERWATT